MMTQEDKEAYVADLQDLIHDLELGDFPDEAQIGMLHRLVDDLTEPPPKREAA